MKKTMLSILVVLSMLLLGMNARVFSTAAEQDLFGKEVDGIQISLHVKNTRVPEGQPLELDLQITNVARDDQSKRFDTYIPWIVDRPSNLYEIRAVDAHGNDINIYGGCGMDAYPEVLHLLPGCFCGYSLSFQPERGFQGKKNLSAGKFKLYAVFQNTHPKLPGPLVNIAQEQIDRLTKEQRAEFDKSLSREAERLERENAKLGKGSLWIGKAFSEKVTVEIVPNSDRQ